MDIFVNGKDQTVPVGYTAGQLVADMGLADKRIAMEVNLEIVPRSTYPGHTFEPGDRVEIVQAVGGG